MVSRALPIWLLAWGPLFGSVAVRAQMTDASAAANQKKAHRILAESIQALGGEAWLDLRTMRSVGRTAEFYQGNPTGVPHDTTETTALPDRERIDSAKGRVVQIYIAREGWEITYKGKKAMPPAQNENYWRWHDHSLGVALRQWVPGPSTMLIDQGQTLVERRVAEKIKLVNASNDAITIEVDAATHLPLRLSFEWRDPQFHDKNLDAVEYDNYRTVDGIATPYTVTRTHNGETVRQRYLLRITYNIALTAGFFDPNQALKHVR